MRERLRGHLATSQDQPTTLCKDLIFAVISAALLHGMMMTSVFFSIYITIIARLLTAYAAFDRYNQTHNLYFYLLKVSYISICIYVIA